MEDATLKLGSIEIEEENLTEEESPETPWWSKLKKKHVDMAEDEEEEEGSTVEPTYSTFSWVEETSDETSTATTTTTRPLPLFVTLSSSSTTSKPDLSSAMTESTTNGN